MSSNNRKPVVNVKYPCYLCDDTYQSAALCLYHVEVKHGIRLPGRPYSVYRPPSKEYEWQTSHDQKWDIIHHGCASCWFHTVNYKEFQQHVKQHHAPRIKKDHGKTVRFNFDGYVLCSHHKETATDGQCDHPKNLLLQQVRVGFNHLCDSFEEML